MNNMYNWKRYYKVPQYEGYSVYGLMWERLEKTQIPKRNFIIALRVISPSFYVINETSNTHRSRYEQHVQLKEIL